MNNDVDKYKNTFKNVTTRKRRPTPVINRFPERDTLGVFKRSKNLIPGYTSEAVRFNTRFIPLIGATIKQMETYVKPIIQDDTPDVLILHIGCNDISNKNMSANDRAEGIINIGGYCKEHNVNVTISSLICRSQKHFQHRVNAVNTMLMNGCKNYGQGYIDNSNIEVGFLAQNGLHLNEIGKSCLANNFINFVNRYIL